MLSQQITIIALSIAAGAFGATGDGLLNKAVQSSSGKILWYIAGFVIWNLSLFFFINLLKRGYLGDSVLLFVISNSIIAILIGNIFFHEPFSNQRLLGICLGISGLIFLMRA